MKGEQFMKGSPLRAPRFWVGALLTCGLVIGCDGGSDPMTPTPPPAGPTIQSVTVTAPADSVVSGGSVQLSAAVTDSNGQVVANPTVVWTSSDASIAAVDASGLVTGQAEGSAIITATVSGVMGSTSMAVFVGSFEPTGNATLSGAVEFTDVNVPAGVVVTVTDDLVLTARNSIQIDGELLGECVGMEITAAEDVNVTGTLDATCSSGRPSGSAGGAMRVLAGGTWTLDDADVRSAGSLLISNLAADLTEAPLAVARVSESSASRSGDCHYRNTRLTGGFTSPDPRGGPDIKLSPDVRLTCDGEMFVEGGQITGGSGDDGADVTASTVAEAGDGDPAGMLLLTGAHVTVWKAPFTIKGGSGGRGGRAMATGVPVTLDAEAIGGNGGDAWLPRFEATAGDGGVFVGADAQLRVEAGTPGNGGDAHAVAHDGADASGSTPAEAAGRALAIAGNGGEVGVPGPDGAFNSTMFVGITVQVLGATLVNPPSLASGGEATTIGGTGGAGGAGAPNGGTGFIVQGAGGNGGRYHVDLPGGQMVRQAGMGGAVNVEGGHGGPGFDGCTVGNIQDGGDGGPGAVIEAVPGMDGIGGPTTAKANFSKAGNGGPGGSGAAPGAGGDPGAEVSPAATRVEVSGPNLKAGASGNLCETAMTTDIRVRADPAGHEPFIGLTTVKLITIALFAQNILDIFAAQPFVPLSGTLGADLGLNATGSGLVAGFNNVSMVLVGALIVSEFNRVLGFTGILTAGANGELFGVPATYDVDSMVPDASEGFDPAVFGLTEEQIEAGVAAGTIIRRNRSSSR